MTLHRFTIVISWVFGTMMIGLSLFVTIETLSRKFLRHSFLGADELGGYVLAVGGALAFSVALVERGHIRIDLLHERLGPRLQAILSWLSAVLMAAMGVFLMRYCWLVVRDTVTYGSTAPTAWATPMIWPQSVWYGALVIFGVISLWQAFRATRLLLAGNIAQVNAEFHTKGAMDELRDELADLEKR